MRTKRFSPAAGYSLYELLVTLTLVAIILSVGVPSFGRLIADARLRVETNALFHAAHLARKESIVRRQVVAICPSADGQTCEDGRWSDGWMMFANVGRSDTRIRTSNERVLMRHRTGVDVQIMSNRRAYQFRSTNLRATNGTLIFCDRSGRASSRALVISYTGRPRVAYADRRGQPYACAH